ncbi:MAG: DUF3570 domain-containing protein [Sphingomonadales bacterium]|nr:DUF3570 domain-containing protein [Sphingomonadales bacterium]
MQLNPEKAPRATGIAACLGALTATLLSATGAQAQQATVPSAMAETAPGPDSTVVDTAILFYQEQGGRVRAIEPTASIAINLHGGDVISGSLTFDSLTGATPNGAAPWTGVQTFAATVPAPSTQVTTTSASGGRTKVTIPGTGLATSTYTTPAGTVPLDSGFHDRRIAGSLGYAFLVDADTRVKVGAALSFEHDYRSYSGNLGVSRDLNQKNTTVSLSANYEYDQSRPTYGTPSAFQDYTTQILGGNDHKSVISLVGGVTQTVTGWWLTQLNYSIGFNKGYQSDPYKVLSVVDPVTGAPLSYLYENRPRSRTRQSVYWGNRIALGPTVADASLRYYHDNWGIGGITAEFSDQIPLGYDITVEPGVRYYHQGAANFYARYLLGGAALPQYASADYRLGKFSALTYSLKATARLFRNDELFPDMDVYLVGERYRQTGTHTDPTAPGALSTLDFFSGVKSFSIMSGIKVKY